MRLTNFARLSIQLMQRQRRDSLIKGINKEKKSNEDR